jgi:nucleoid-associated protein Lsr2
VARQVTEKLIDDLDGGEAVETVAFGLDGASYEIDLSKRNAAALRRAFEQYVTAARATSAAASTRRRSGAPAAKRAAKKPTAATKRDYDLVALREWAGANGVAVPSRGRIPQTVVEQYRASGGR